MSDAAARFIIRRLAFTGPKVPIAELLFVDDVNVIWGSSNSGKSFTVKALDFMSGAKANALPDIGERRGYDKAWLQLSLPVSGHVTLMRSVAGGSFGIYDRWVEPGISEDPARTLSADHKAKDSLSAFLLSEIGIVGKKVARTQNGDKSAFSIRHFAAYLYTEETDMMAEWSPIRISDYKNETLDKNVLKFITTGIDDSAVITTPSSKVQKSSNSGKIELVDEMLAAAEQEFQRDYPNSTDIEDQLSKIENSIDGLQATLGQRQDRLDQLRLERRSLMEEIAGTQERQTEIAISLERFEVLRRIYDSDVERLSSLEEGGVALMAGSRRSCPLCGAAPDHQDHTHGLEEVQLAQRAVRAEIVKILLERSDLSKASASLKAEQDGFARKADRMVVDLQIVDREIAEARPLEVASRSIYEDSTRVRDRLQFGMMLSRRIEDLKKRKSDLGKFRPSSTPKAEINVGVGGVIGHELAMAVQSVLHAWHFPGYPTIAFDGATHDILINGKSRPSNGKGVRALMNAAFKIGVLIYCRQKQLPHPGVLVLDSPLLSYREPQKSRHGPLSEDEKAIKSSGVKDYFFAYLKEKSEFAQFIVIENDPPPSGVDAYAKVYAFVGDEGEEGRKGFF